MVDVPGHERFVRTMVAGASGIDLFLLCIAADDGVMPQTVEHWKVLQALGVERGVVAVTKSDLGPLPDLPDFGAEVVPVSVKEGRGIDALRDALDRAASAPVSAERVAGATLTAHVDRVFTIRGAGTVVTGTLWSGSVAAGDVVTLLPSGRAARVRGVQVHDADAERAEAGQRVAINLAGVDRDQVSRGDVVTSEPFEPSYVIDVELDFDPPKRVMVHHGTRETAARATRNRLRCEKPLLTRPGERLVIRSIAPPDTLGGGTVLQPPPEPTPSMPAVEPEPAPRALRKYRGDSDPDEVWPAVEALLPATLGEVRDALGVGRKEAQLLLEHFDATGRTLRRGDQRVRRRRRAAP